MLPAILQYDFMIRAFVAATIVAAIAPIIGTFLVMRNYALLADTLAHTTFMIVALAIVTRINALTGAIIGAAGTGALLELLRSKTRGYNDALLSILMAGALAVGSIIITRSSISVSISGLLFGSITGISNVDIVTILIIAIATALLLFIGWRAIIAIACDETTSRVAGLPVTAINYIFMMVTAIVIVIASRITGILLIGALMIIPVMTAQYLANSFKKTIICAVIAALIAVWVGLTAAWYLNIPAGSAVVLASIIEYLAARIMSRT